MQSKAATVAQYLAELPPERRAAIEAVRRVFKANIDPLCEEGMQYGMIGYYIPHSVYPPGYHCDPRQPLPFAGLASQKNHMSMYIMAVYGSGAEERWLRTEWMKAGKKLDMGKCCIRFKKLEDLPLDVVGQLLRRVTVKSYIAFYEEALAARGKASAKPPAKPAAKKIAKKSAKKVAKKSAKKVAKKTASR